MSDELPETKGKEVFLGFCGCISDIVAMERGYITESTEGDLKKTREEAVRLLGTLRKIPKGAKKEGTVCLMREYLKPTRTV